MSRVRIAIIGSGPAGLMAAEFARRSGSEVTIFEKRPSLGRKILIAGSSRLNITYDVGLETFINFYRCREVNDRQMIDQCLRFFKPSDWIKYLADINVESFVGTSGRVLIKDQKASHALKVWTEKLKAMGVSTETKMELYELKAHDQRVDLCFRPYPHDQSVEPTIRSFDACILALGSPAWETQTASQLSQLLEPHGVQIRPFIPSNVGYSLPNLEKFLKECEGRPLKNCALTTASGTKRGDIMVTSYGIEGTPVYYVGTSGLATLNLKPNVSHERWLIELLKPAKENYSPMRRMQRLGGLSESSYALLYHTAPDAARSSIEKLAQFAQAVPLELVAPRTLEESISASGGVCFSELDRDFQLKRLPKVYAIGEMLDWDAPTGGFLIQGCVSMGAYVGAKIAGSIS